MISDAEGLKAQKLYSAREIRPAVGWRSLHGERDEFTHPGHDSSE
jgi:hypothetical protein